MEISLKCNFGYTLIFRATNVNVEENIEERIYSKTEDGKIDFSKPPQRDISTDALNQITGLLEGMIYYRAKDFDSSSLIKGLFEKLPQDTVVELLVKLNKDYAE